MILRKNLEQLYQALNKRFDTDFTQYESLLNDPGSIRIQAIGEIAESVRSIEWELKKITTSISLAEDMEKGLVKTNGIQNSQTAPL